MGVGTGGGGEGGKVRGGGCPFPNVVSAFVDALRGEVGRAIDEKNKNKNDDDGNDNNTSPPFLPNPFSSPLLSILVKKLLQKSTTVSDLFENYDIFVAILNFLWFVQHKAPPSSSPSSSFLISLPVVKDYCQTLQNRVENEVFLFLFVVNLFCVISSH